MGCVKITNSLRAGVLSLVALRKVHARHALETRMHILEVSCRRVSSSDFASSPLRHGWSLNDGPLPAPPPPPPMPRTLSDEQLADILTCFSDENDDDWVPSADWTAISDDDEDNDDDLTMTTSLPYEIL